MRHYQDAIFSYTLPPPPTSQTVGRAGIKQNVGGAQTPPTQPAFAYFFTLLPDSFLSTILSLLFSSHLLHLPLDFYVLCKVLDSH